MIIDGKVIGSVTFKDVLNELVRLGLQAGSPEGIALVQSFGLPAEWLKPRPDTLKSKKRSYFVEGDTAGMDPRFLEGY